MPRRDDERIEVWRRFLVAHAALMDVLEHELQEEHGLVSPRPTAPVCTAAP